MKSRFEMRSPRLIWDIGTAYDLFVSLHMLYGPAKYGLRGAWAAGVRSRLPAVERATLQQAQTLLLKGPYHWIHALQEPKDGAVVLKALERIPAAERLPRLALSPDMPAEWASVLRGVAARQRWTKKDRDALQAALDGSEVAFSKQDVIDTLKEWARPDEFGERYLDALRAYHDVFFAEEETRIWPALQAALSRAQSLAERLDVPDLLEELSQGLRFAQLPQAPELALAPSFWTTPLITEARLRVDRILILFGARPADASLVPGEVVPDALFRALKAMADPTRLRILRYLAAEPLTPTELARRLRLRAPTVVHHLYALRIAGLVHLTLEAGNERHYKIRPEGVAAALTALERFLGNRGIGSE